LYLLFYIENPENQTL